MSVPRIADPVMLGIIAKSHCPVFRRSGKNIEEVHRILGWGNGRPVVALRDDIHVTVVEGEVFVNRAVDGVNVEQSLAGRVAVWAVGFANSEVVNLFVVGWAISDAIMAVRWPG